MVQKTICLVYNTSKYLYLHRLELLKTLLEMGNTVYVLAPEDRYTSKIRNEGAIFIAFPIDRKGMNLFKEIYSSWKIFKIYRKIKPEIVHHFTPKPIIYGTFIGNLLGIPVIINSINGLGTLWINSFWGKRLLLFLYKHTLNYKNTQNIFQNKHDMELLISKSIASPINSKVIESCGINLEKYSQKKYNINVKDRRLFTFLFLSRMLYDKGLEELKCASIELYTEREDFRVILAGELDDGNPMSVGNKWMQTISGNSPISWIGFVDDAPELIANCDVMILPSYREGFSQSLVEALAIGRPIITTDVPGCREMIDGNGFLVAPKNVTELKDAMNNMLQPNAEIKEMRRRSKIMSKRYDVSLINQQTIALYGIKADYST